jgi:hypothetical protein
VTLSDVLARYGSPDYLLAEKVLFVCDVDAASENASVRLVTREYIIDSICHVIPGYLEGEIRRLFHVGDWKVLPVRGGDDIFPLSSGRTLEVKADISPGESTDASLKAAIENKLKRRLEVDLNGCAYCVKFRYVTESTLLTSMYGTAHIRMGAKASCNALACVYKTSDVLAVPPYPENPKSIIDDALSYRSELDPIMPRIEKLRAPVEGVMISALRASTPDKASVMACHDDEGLDERPAYYGSW